MSVFSKFMNRGTAASVVMQTGMVAGIIYLAYLLFHNTQANLEARNIASGFGFLSVEAGFPISNTLLPYTPADTYGWAFFIGVINTLYVSVLSIAAATALGVLIGVARVSGNWLVAKLAQIYVDTLRNIPLLLTLFFSYTVVLASLPAPRASLTPFTGFFLNNRGIYVPKPLFQEGFGYVVISVVASIIAVFLFARWADRYRERTGHPLASARIGAVILVAVPTVTYFALGAPLAWEHPVLEGFNFQRGMVLRPEFSALMIGLVLYTAAFIGENVRSGIQSVNKGQLDAAMSFGVNHGVIMRRVILPQALRVTIPATTNDYASLVKNSSLAVAIGYPDMVSVGGTIIGQNDQAIEIIGLWMAVYLSMNLIISTFMNWFNSRVQLVER